MSTVGPGDWSLDGGSLEEGRWCVDWVEVWVWVFTSSPFLLINLLPLGQYTGFGGLLYMLGGFEQSWSFFTISIPIWDFLAFLSRQSFTSLHLSVSDEGIR